MEWGKGNSNENFEVKCRENFILEWKLISIPKWYQGKIIFVLWAISVEFDTPWNKINSQFFVQEGWVAYKGITFVFVYNIKISKWKVLNELNDTDIKSFNSHLSRIKKKKILSSVSQQRPQHSLLSSLSWAQSICHLFHQVTILKVLGFFSFYLLNILKAT